MNTKPSAGALTAQVESPLVLGNRANRAGDYAAAIAQYLRALQSTPALGKTIGGNLALARHKYRASRAACERQRVGVCGWELAHNAAGRVYTLAKLYETFADVEIIGSMFPSWGKEIWEPIRSTTIPRHTFVVDDESRFLEQALELVAAHPYDIVHLSKPRASNIFFGILYKLIWDAKVLVDIDDEELAFVDAETPISIDNYIKQHDKLPELKDLADKDWTRLAVGMAKEFDGVTVSNPALQQRYGGEIIRHARDEKLFNPTPELKHKSREKFGIQQDKKVVLFFGTPHERNGLLETADAIASLKRTDMLFVIVGDFPEPILKERLKQIKGVDCIFIGNQPFDSIPEVTAIGDYCVLLQDIESKVSQFQVPAKMSDALGMGLVVLVSRTLALSETVDIGAVIASDIGKLTNTLRQLIEDVNVSKSVSERAVSHFAKILSFSAALTSLQKTINKRVVDLHSQFNRKKFFNISCQQFRVGYLSKILEFCSIAELAASLKGSVPAKSIPKEKQQQTKIPKTALIITWDIGHNPLGRSYMLAEVLDRVVRNVVLVGFQFPRYGDDVWEPVRHGRLPVISLPGENLPEFLDSLDKIAQRMQPDIVIACKPRLPSMQLGALIKQKFGCPLIVDIDDHELSFFKNASEITNDDLARMPDSAANGQIEPYNEIWTRVAQHMCKYADERIVSNVALQREFGGTIVPHVRDEHAFDPSLYDKSTSRIKYGIPLNAKVVLFCGTPRHHKGVDVLADAVGRIEDNSFQLVVVGSTTDRSVTSKLDLLAPGRVIYLPNQPFSSLPEIVVMADVICLPQDVENPISSFQLPAKAIDAVAMGIPLLVTRTPPLMQLVHDGVAVLIDYENLPDQLRRSAIDGAHNKEWYANLRAHFMERYSYRAAAKLMREIVERALRNGPQASLDDLPTMLAHQRRVIGASTQVNLQRAHGTDIVVFWKQNDTALYGRRSDMVIRYLASRQDVRRVIVFDAPISEFDLLKRRDTHSQITHDRLIYLKTYEKVFGKLDTEKISYNVFVTPLGAYNNSKYADFIKGVCEREGVRPHESVFWIYPKNFMAPELIDLFSPAKVVVDVVDDHRTWPDVTEKEHQRLTDNYRQTLGRAHMAFVNCAPMVDTMRKFYPAIRLVPNGCDTDPPMLQPKNDPEFDAFMARGGKTIGFVGNLEKKIDILLIAKIAECFPDCQVVLLGSTHANPQVLQLKRYPNVRFPGVVPYEQIGAWLSRFDVGIIPHLDLEMTRSMNPLKLYVYLSWRVPVVSTEIYNIEASSRFVRVARTHDEFLEHVARVLEEGRIDEAALRRYIDENSWEARFSTHVDELLAPLKEKPYGH